MSELMVLLDEEIPERSIRRWLQELVIEGLIEKNGQKKGTRYRAIQPHQSISLQQEIFTAQSFPAITYVKQPLYARDPKSYQFKWLDSYEPNKTFYLPQEKREYLKQHGIRRYQHDIAGTYARHIYNRLLIDLSYNSSRLEGNTYSLVETEKLIIEGNISEKKLTAESIMILNHKEAIRYIVNNAENLKIEPQVIYTLHYLLSDSLLPPSACGIVRNHSVKIGGSTYLPLDNKKKN